MSFITFKSREMCWLEAIDCGGRVFLSENRVEMQMIVVYYWSH